MPVTKILVIDDEISILETLGMFFEEKGLAVLTADTGAGGMDLFLKERPQVVILDIRLPDTNGLDILKSMVQTDLPVKVIMITAFQDMETTILAMKTGAFDYIHKPLDIDQVEQAVDRAARIIEIDRKTPSLQTAPENSDPLMIIGKSEKMRHVFKMMGLVCSRQVNVLLQGDTGTGKELTARVIHTNSPCKDAPFIVFDCSAVVDTIIESELFGHEKGAFTGADQTTTGKIELAGSGTLFLDEISQLPLKIQGKLLGFLQRKEYTRVGGTRVLKSSCRIMAASNQDLSTAGGQGTVQARPVLPAQSVYHSSAAPGRPVVGHPVSGDPFSEQDQPGTGYRCHQNPGRGHGAAAPAHLERQCAGTGKHHCSGPGGLPGQCAAQG
jgi:two-component system, NtrC family, response regulator AtoC